MTLSFSGFNEYDRQWRKQRYGHYVVTDLAGNVIWTRGHSTCAEKGRITGQVATLLEPGRLWAWGETKEEAVEQIARRINRIRGTRALPAAEVMDEGGNEETRQDF